MTIAAPFAVGVSPAAAAELPSGAELQVRLLAPVSSRHSRPGQAVAARLIAPVVAGGHTLLPAGSELRGEVRVAGVGPDHRARLRLEFSVLVPGPGVDPLKIDGRVVSVDNARETVDAAGRIVGLPPLRLRPSKVEVLLLLAAHAHPVVLGLAEAGKLARRQAGPPAIAYGAGVEMTLRLLEAVRLPAEAAVAPAVGEDLAADVDLVRLASAPPFRAVAARLRAPCDLINIMFVGSGADLHAGFVQAGWSSAAAGARADVMTFLAFALRHGYKPAPVSLLELEGRRPDAVFEKQNDTLAKRHHVRIWRRPSLFRGRPVWLAAATHDVDITFLRKQRTFTHRVDPRIDLERGKIVDDLALTGQVAAWGLIDRPPAPRDAATSTGDRIETDGRIAVVLFRP